ncbi:hypothetical protein DFH11DRAFT_1542950 [Phellopilus nigrolimitatus]|nr:hypothetical protein DFH11DRAFT_1542950 [Phellopilus nigrolimitatus]
MYTQKGGPGSEPGAPWGNAGGALRRRFESRGNELEVSACAPRIRGGLVDQRRGRAARAGLGWAGLEPPARPDASGTGRELKKKKAETGGGRFRERTSAEPFLPSSDPRLRRHAHRAPPHALHSALSRQPPPDRNRDGSRAYVLLRPATQTQAYNIGRHESCKGLLRLNLRVHSEGMLLTLALAGSGVRGDLVPSHKRRKSKKCGEGSRISLDSVKKNV